MDTFVIISLIIGAAFVLAGIFVKKAPTYIVVVPRSLPTEKQIIIERLSNILTGLSAFGVGHFMFHNGLSPMFMIVIVIVYFLSRLLLATYFKNK